MMKLHILFICLVSLMSCTRATKDATTRVTLTLPQFSETHSQNKISPLKLNPIGVINPNSLSEIDCYGLVVSGPEESLSRNVCTYQNGQTAKVGFFSGGYYFANNSTSAKKISLDIPSGVDRKIRLVGFQVDTLGAPSGLTAEMVCSQFFSTTKSYENYLSDPYVLAESNSLVLPGGGTVDVNLTAVFDSSLKVNQCKGPDFQNDDGSGAGTSGPPTKLAIQFQDGIGQPGGTKPLQIYSCVALRIQLQDSNGNGADVSASPVITAKLKTSLSNQAVGDFYAGESSGFCNGSALPVDASNDITLSFNNGVTNFSDYILFFKPAASPSAPRTIQVEGITGASIDTTVYDFNFTTSTFVASKYAVLDLYNLRSTSSAQSSVNPVAIKNNNCRVGALQFLDSNGVPMIVSTPTVPNAVSIDTTLGAQFNFYSSDANCVGNVSPSSIQTISFTGVTNYSGKGLYYQISPGVTGNFSFEVLNTGSNTNVISGSSDLSFSENFWQATSQ